MVYCYEKTRGADHLREFYAGLLEMIYLTCDAYSAYPCFADESNGLIVLAGCFMHCRRSFVEAILILNLKGMADEQILALPETQAILLIREIYLAEGLLKDLSLEERLTRRKKEVLPNVNAFFEFIRGIDLNNPLLSEKLKVAVHYSLNQEIYLRRFLTDGSIPIDLNGWRKLVVSGIPIGVQISFISLKKILWMFGTPCFLVFIQYQLLPRLLSGSVEPHVALALCFSIRFVENLERGLIRMEDVLFQQFLVHLLPDRLQPQSTGFQ